MERAGASSRRQAGGFTLLEVMIALAIVGLCLTALTRSQLASVRASNRAKMLTIATMLARYKMLEVEDQLFEKGFSDFKQEEKQSFKEQGFEKFSYTLVVDKVEMPAAMNTEGLQRAMTSMGGGSGQGSGSTKSSSTSSPTGMASGLASTATSIMGKQMEMVRNLLEQSIRRVEVKVLWKEGKVTRDVTVDAYFTDPRKIDAALGGGFTGVGTGSGSGSGTGAGSSSGTSSGTGTSSVSGSIRSTTSTTR